MLADFVRPIQVVADQVPFYFELKIHWKKLLLLKLLTYLTLPSSACYIQGNCM